MNEQKQESTNTKSICQDKGIRRDSLKGRGTIIEKNVITEENTLTKDIIRKEKKQLRKRILRKRSEMSEAQREAAGEEIFRKVCALPFYEKVKAVLTYVSFSSEVPTRSFIRRALSDGKRVFVPRVIDISGKTAERKTKAETDSESPSTDPVPAKVMEFYEIDSLDHLIVSSWGIAEPPEDPARSFEKMLEENMIFLDDCLMIMPGSAFDRERHRMGYNGGFYDRYLSHCPMKATIAVAFDLQIVENVPHDWHDRKPSIIVTEKETIE